jgi:phospholipid/cholesterol/gamma-HCH transport system substrate-binding protein
MKLSDTRFGIFAFLFGTVLLFGALVVFSRYPTLLSKGIDFHAQFDNVAGLNVGGEVRYGGMLVGSVTSIELDPDDPTQIDVKFRVDKGTPVREDTKAAITQTGFLGEQYLNLQPGDRNSGPLPEGSTLASEDNLNFQDAMNKVARFLERTDTLMVGLETLAKSSPFERFDRTLTRLDEMVANASIGSSRAFESMDRVAAQVALVLTRTDRMLATADSSFRTVGPGLGETQREALATLRETRAMVAELRDALQQEGGMDDLVRNLSIASENLARITDRIDRDPASLLRQPQAPKKTVGPPVIRPDHP